MVLVSLGKISLISQSYANLDDKHTPKQCCKVANLNKLPLKPSSFVSSLQDEKSYATFMKCFLPFIKLWVIREEQITCPKVNSFKIQHCSVAWNPNAVPVEDGVYAKLTNTERVFGWVESSNRSSFLLKMKIMDLLLVLFVNMQFTFHRTLRKLKYIYIKKT